MNKPSKTQVGGDHYKEMPIQPHYFCHVNKLGALESNVVKYVCRHSRKGGKADLLKARHYIDLLLEWQYDDDGQTAPADGRLPDHIDEIAALTRRIASVGGASLISAPQIAVQNEPSPGKTWAVFEDKSLRGTEVQCVCGWTGPSSELKRATARTHPFCPDCGADFPPAELPQSWPYTSHATCEAHGLTICKVCEFPAGTSYGGTSD